MIGSVVLLTLLAFVLGSGCYVVGFAVLAIGKGLVDELRDLASSRARR